MTCWAAEAPEVGPETGYSSIGGMLPYWVPPQGVSMGLATSLLRSKFVHREAQYVIRCVESPHPQTVVSAMAGSQFPMRELKSTQALFAIP
jgi:hypothetical protein